jgi:hypothetical protein
MDEVAVLFIVLKRQQRGGETGCQAAAGGASSKCQLQKRR